MNCFRLYLWLFCFSLNETCILLTLIKGSALLLRETLVALEGATGVEDIRGRALREMGVTYLTPNMALNILNRRTDINLNMFVIDWMFFFEIFFYYWNKWSIYILFTFLSIPSDLEKLQVSTVLFICFRFILNTNI